MKKYILSLLLFLLTLSAPQKVNAFDFDWGITAGMNLTKLSLDGDYQGVFSSKNRIGWFAGPKINLNIALGLGIDASLLYQQYNYNMGFDLSYVEYSTTRRQQYVSLPINARYNLGLGETASIYIATGPQFDFGIGEKSEDWFSTTFQQKNMTTTWNVGAGVRILKGLEIGLAYNIPIGKTGESIDTGNLGSTIIGSIWQTDKNQYKANTFKIHLSYYF